MLKVRLMGSKKDIRWFEKIMRRNQKVAVTGFSEPYRIKGSKRYHRVYAEVERAGK